MILRLWFTALYEVLLGQSQGPRFGSFAAIFGLQRTTALIEKARADAEAAAAELVAPVEAPAEESAAS